MSTPGEPNPTCCQVCGNPLGHPTCRCTTTYTRSAP